MRRTFPSFGLKSVIRLCAFMLTMCVLINSERANAQAPVFRAGDTATLTICYPGAGMAVASDTIKDLSALLGVDCHAGDTLSWAYITLPGGVLLGGSTPLITTTGVDERLSIVLTSTVNTQSTRYLTIRVHNDAGLADTIVVLIREWLRPVSAPIMGLDSEVHEGETISFSNASAGGTWVIASGTRSFIDASGNLTYGSGPTGLDTVIYRKTNVCYTTDSLFPVLFLLGTGPLSHSATGAGFTPTIIASDTAWGVPGNSFVISGTNFNATPANNTVYFGGVRAAVVSGSTSSLTVTIPFGATFDRISVMDNITRRTGYMRHQFTETFNNCAFSGTDPINLDPYDSIILRGGIGAGSLGARPYSVEFSDLDGDGKLDMAICGTDSIVGQVVVYRNVSSTGTVNRSSFSGTPISVHTGIPDTTYSRMLINLKMADMDGDGKPDIIAASPATGRIYIFRNTSTSGSISFDTAFYVSNVNISTGAGVLPAELSIADYDHDGRPDIGVVSVGTVAGSDGATSTIPGALTIIKNNYNKRRAAGSFMGTYDFVANTIFTYNPGTDHPLSLCSGDFDGDGNMDIAVTDHYSRNFKVFQHVPTATSIAFNAPTTVSTAVTIASLTDHYGSHRFGYPNQIRSGDFNRDGKQELIVAVSDSDLLVDNKYNHLNVYSNNAYGTGIAFGSLVQLNTGVGPVGIAIADLNGDHALDIICTNSGAGSVSIIKNTSSGGGIVTYANFDTANVQTYVVERNSPSAPSFSTGIFGGPVSVAIADIDNNSINDFVVVSREANLVSIVRNNPLPVVSPISSADTICVGSTITVNSGRPNCSNANGVWTASNTNVTVTATGTGIGDVNATVTANAIGTDTLYYSVTSLGDVNRVMKVIYVVDSAHAGTITGANNICLNSSTTLSNTTGVNGTWTTSSAATATITASATSTATVRGDAVGSATITYTATAPSCPSRFTTFGITVNRLPNADTIAGSLTPCAGSSTTYTTSGVAGGTWMLSSTALATITTTSGTTASLHTGTATGAVTLMYIDATTFCGSDTAFLTVNIINSVAPPITGAATVCVGFTTTYTDTAAGGTWTSSAPSVASVESSTGIVHGVAVGSATISYTVTTGACSSASATQTITVLASPGAPTISGADSVCKLASTTLTTTGTGGNWSSTDATVATVSTAGVVTGLTVGSATISYTISNSCGTVAGTHLITVNPLPNAGTVTGPDTLCPGIPAGGTYTSTGDAGTWSVFSSSIATIDASGFAYGVTTTGGSTTITYSTTSVHGCGTVTATHPLFIRANAVPGTVSGPSPICENVLTTYTVTGGDAGGTWSATPGGSTISSGGDYTAPVGSGSPAGIGYTVTYTVTNICGSQSASASVVVRAKPNVTVITGPVTVCTGVNITESATPSTGAGGTIVWGSLNPTVLSFSSSTTSSGTYHANTPGVAVIYDSVTNMCGTTVRNATITVNQSPDAGRITGPTQVCVGSSPVFTVHGSTDQLGGNWSSISTPLAYSFTTDSSATYDALLAGRGIVTYEVVNSCGRDTAFDTVTVVRLPIAGNDHTTIDTICPGTSVVLTADATGFATMWVTSDASIATVSASGSSTVTVTGVATGNAVIYNIDSNSCGTDTAMYNVHVNPATPTPGTIFGNDSSCKGLTFVFSDTTADTSAGAGVWSTSTGSIASIAGATTTTVMVTGNNAGTAVIRYTVTNSCGASSTTKSVKINEFPHFTSPLTASVCDSIVLNYTPTTDSASSFNWIRDIATNIVNPADTGVGSISHYLDNSSNVNATVIYHYAANAHGCVTNQDLTVTVKPTPYLNSATNITVCSGVQLTYIDTESVAGSSATWTRPTLTYAANHLIGSGGTSGTHTISEVLTSDTLAPVNVVYLYSLNANGCTNSASVKVTVNPRPAFPTLSTHPSSNICAGTMYMNFGSSVVPPAGVNYAWSATNAVIWATGNTRQYSLVNFTNPGTAYVYLLATLPGYTCAAKDSFGVIVSNSVSDNPTVIYFNGDFVCLSNVEDSYQWGYDDHNTLDSATFPGQTNQNYTELSPDFNGKWYWVITTHNGCEQKSYYRVPTGIKNITGTMGDIKLYPNPAEQYVNVEVSNTSGGSFSVDVMNMLGQKVSSQNMIGDKAIINVADLAAGVYFVDCYRDGVKFATEKFVKN